MTKMKNTSIDPYSQTLDELHWSGLITAREHKEYLQSRFTHVFEEN